ncbi:Zinc finger and BTB domain-containing protein 9 [Bienertia sinuspersici]
METLSSSVILSKIPETKIKPCSQFSIKTWNRRGGCLKINESLNLSSRLLKSEKVDFSGSSRVLAVPKEGSGETEKNPASDDANGLVSEDFINIAQDNANPTPSPKRSFGSDSPKIVSTPAGSGSGSGTGGGTRAGLFRTPISGGVQSATSAHGLPSPALAVRNLMEQARFAHLCTVMSRMHHRRQGYPFGSLVDFAPDAMGHPIFSFSPLAIHTRNLLADPRCTLVVQELNAIFSKPLKELLSTKIEVDDAALISIDSRGIDVRVRQGAQFNIQRVSFENGRVVETLEEAKSALQQLINKGQVHNVQK